MGKLMDRLQRQLKEPEHKQDAEDCIAIYNWIKETDKNGNVWSSRWEGLVSSTAGEYPIRRYKLNVTGRTLLSKIQSDKEEAKPKEPTYTREDIIHAFTSGHNKAKMGYTHSKALEMYKEKNNI